MTKKLLFRCLWAAAPALGGALAAVAAEVPARPVLWPGYTVEFPAGYCADVTKGPDFDVFYVHARGGSSESPLVGIYAGHAPNFDPHCARPTTRTWISNHLRFKSVRGADNCAEFLVDDPTSSDRGMLHIWFGPAAKKHTQLAENLIASLRPAVMPLADASKPPPCK